MATGDRPRLLDRGVGGPLGLRELPRLGARLPVFRVDEAGEVRREGTLRLLNGHEHAFEREGDDRRYEGLPPFIADMAPQGFLGRAFALRETELELPARIADWTEDHVLLALARRGEDCVGDRIVGNESLDRFLAHDARSIGLEDFPAARRGEHGLAGGEFPKFLAYVEGRHCLVKFVDASQDEASIRLRDLLVCEALALETVRAAGLEAAEARTRWSNGALFLEIVRFDRFGQRGRRALHSLAAIDAEHIGRLGTWSQLAEQLDDLGLIDPEDARRVRWLDTFGELIANPDRHLGNVSFLEGEAGGPTFRLAPIYDMLPMRFAREDVLGHPFLPAPPVALNQDVWTDAAEHASRFWQRVATCGEISGAFQERAQRCAETLARLRARHGTG
jgi:hypothetical protein